MVSIPRNDQALATSCFTETEDNDFTGADTATKANRHISISPTQTGHCIVAACAWIHQIDDSLPYTFTQSKCYVRYGRRIKDRA